MTIDLNRLKTMNKEELITLAKQTNTPYHHNNSNEKLVENIINKVMESTTSQTKAPEQTEKKEAVFLTEEELEVVFAPIKERYKAFSTVYDHEAKCVTMRYYDGRYKHAETMSLSCPITKFKRKAPEIAKGPLVLPTHRTEDWERLGTANGKNAYTAVVLG